MGKYNLKNKRKRSKPTLFRIILRGVPIEPVQKGMPIGVEISRDDLDYLRHNGEILIDVRPMEESDEKIKKFVKE